MKLSNLFKLVLSVGVCLIAGGIGSIFTFKSINTWYATLNKPFFNPPNWIFGPVWTTLYIIMGIALFLVIKDGFKNKDVKKASILFGVQLILNILWSLVFFTLQEPGWAFLVIILLWISILATIISFYKISKLSGVLLIPYILWVSFASLLNFYIWILNIWI